MKNSPVILTRNPALLRWLLAFASAPIVLMSLFVYWIQSSRTPEQAARIAARHPALNTALLPWLALALCASLVVLLRVLFDRAMPPSEPLVTIDETGITWMQRDIRGRVQPYLVPWDHVTAIRRSRLSGFDTLYVELVADHADRRAEALGLTGWPAWRAKHLGVVRKLGPAGTPTALLPSMNYDVSADDLQAVLEKYRADALLSDGRRPALARR